MWNADEIKEVEERLRTIRDELQFKLIIGVRENVQVLRAQGQRAGPAPELNEVMRLLVDAEATRSARHNEVIKLQKQLLDVINTSAKSLLQASHAHDPSSADSRRRERAEHAIITSLWYPCMRDREASICDAHANTFNWLFHESDVAGKRWDNFVDFLEGPTGLYWITGKPGSGKSTLMKYLQNDPRTKQHLGTWAAGKELLDASFYFFYNGKSDMQKSEHGMLTSLLHSLLKQKRDLIPSAFGERLRHLCLHPDESLSKPTLQEARQAIKQLFTTRSDTAFFLSIDGLDEFDAKVSESQIEALLTLGRSLTEYPNVKIIFASRPLIQFEDAFSDCPSLRMHELTHDDIRRYVDERLEKHRYMQKLLHRDTTNAMKLVKTIVESSSGVFLWVRLVVDSLIDGLRNSDTVQDLQRRLDVLPTDLYDLYDAILSQVPESYRFQTMKLLRLVLCGVDRGYNLSVQGLWFAEEDTNNLVMETEIAPLSEEDLEHRFHTMERRINSRCRGLVEISRSGANWDNLRDMNQAPCSDIYDPENKLINTRVVLLHRSVQEFLWNYDWGNYTNLDGKSTNPWLPLLRSAILMLKTYRFEPDKENWPIILKLAVYAGMRAENSQKSHIAQTAALLKALDKIMSNHHTKLQVSLADNLDIPEMFNINPGVESHWSAWYQVSKGLPDQARKSPQQTKPNFMTFATSCGLTKYLEYQLMNNGPSSLRKPGLSLLGYAICQPLHCLPFQMLNPHMVEFLLREFKPSEVFLGVSLWSWVLQIYNEDMDIGGCCALIWAESPAVLSSMLLLLRAGANPHECVTWPSGCFSSNESKISLLRAARRTVALYEDSERDLATPRGVAARDRVRDLVTLLEELGATEKEWIYGVLVFPPSSQEEMAIPLRGQTTGNEEAPTNPGRQHLHQEIQLTSEALEDTSDNNTDTTGYSDGFDSATESPPSSVGSDAPEQQKNFKRNISPQRARRRPVPKPSKRRKSLLSRLRGFGKRLASLWKRWTGFWRRH